MSVPPQIPKNLLNFSQSVRRPEKVSFRSNRSSITSTAKSMFRMNSSPFCTTAVEVTASGGSTFARLVDGTVADLTPEPAVARVRASSSLRQALEVILTSRSSIAVVVDDDDTYQGAVTLEAIREGLSR